MRVALALASALTCSSVAALAAPAAAQATTWYVDVAASPPGLGTQASPYTSIQYAITRPTTLAGDTLEVAPGTYAENVDINKQGLKVRSSGGPLATTITPSAAGAVVRISSGSTSAVALEGFTITGSFGASATGILIAVGANGSVSRCVVYGNPVGVNVIWDAGMSSCTITNNVTGLVVGGAARLYASHSIVQGNATDVSCASGLLPIADFSWSLVPALTFPCVSNLYATFFADPQFWSATQPDVRLQAGSPCVDAGDPALTDPDGSRRDIGAVPFDDSYAPATPTIYCTAKTNSQGCSPSIGFAGAPSASGAPFSVSCSNVINQKSGLLFYGYAPHALPYQGGFLCVRSPARRTALQNSGGNPPPEDCSGLYGFDFDALIQSGADPLLVAGQAVFIQYWFRDPAAPPPFSTGRSNALAATIAP
jgi:hypothetical protein